VFLEHTKSRPSISLPVCDSGHHWPSASRTGDVTDDDDAAGDSGDADASIATSQASKEAVQP
jgi:hypothetical protein